MSTDINRIAELAKEDPKRQFYSTAHLITVAKMYEAFRSLRKDASAGITLWRVFWGASGVRTAGM